MFSSRRICAVLAVAATGLFSAHAAVAEENGTFTALASMVHDYTTIEHAAGTIVGGASEGTMTVLASSGGPFVAGEHGHVTCVVYGKSSAAGLELEAPCTLATAAEDELYLVSKRRVGDVEAGGGGDGAIELLGGSGKYAGATGTCTYDTSYLANDRLVTMTECAWRRSAAAQ